MNSYNVISNTDLGRIYISNFEIEKLVYKTIQSDYPRMNCYKVVYDQSALTLYIHPDSSFDGDRSSKIQKDAKKIFSDSYGIYIENVNLILN